MTITFWFDPNCPFTWRTSRWARDVAARRGDTVDWRLMSLAVLNEGKEIPEQYRDLVAWGKGALRVFAAVAERHGQDALDRFYTAVGTRVHGRHDADRSAILPEALAEAGLPAELASAVDDESLDDGIRRSHDEAQASVGTEAGSPILSIDGGPGFFGPVIAPVPRGDDADRLFEALRLLSSVPQFSELKRARHAL